MAAAELGSFAKAAERLHISTTALAKQIDAFEGEHGFTLFERTHRGVALTPAGTELVKRVPAFMEQSHDILRAVRELDAPPQKVVKLGVSLLCPARKTLGAWPRIHALCPGIRLELTPVEDIYDRRADVVGHLGKTVDFIQTSWSTPRWRGRCQALDLGTTPLAIDVPRHNRRLADKTTVTIDDLAGSRVYVLREMDDARDELIAELEQRGDIECVEVDTYSLELFNECVESGGVMITSGALAGLHPMLKTVPFADDRPVRCVLLYPLDPSPAAARFVEAYRQLLG